MLGTHRAVELQIHYHRGHSRDGGLDGGAGDGGSTLTVQVPVQTVLVLVQVLQPVQTVQMPVQTVLQLVQTVQMPVQEGSTQVLETEPPLTIQGHLEMEKEHPRASFAQLHLPTKWPSSKTVKHQMRKRQRLQSQHRGC